MGILKRLEDQTTGDDPIPIRADDAPGKESRKRETALYASTNLTFFETNRPHDYGRDYVAFFGTCFRRLDPDYYAWLRHKMDLAKKAASSGGITTETFDTLRTRFNVIHAWAIAYLEEEALCSALQSLDLKTYAPPRIDSLDRRPNAAPPVPKASSPALPPYLYPQDGDWRFTQRVRSSAVTKVDAIRDQAISLGWSYTRLYQNRGRFRFPCGEDYGLVCFLDENKRIGEVTRQSIEIVGSPPNESRLRFYNPRKWINHGSRKRPAKREIPICQRQGRAAAGFGPPSPATLHGPAVGPGQYAIL